MLNKSGNKVRSCINFKVFIVQGSTGDAKDRDVRERPPKYPLYFVLKRTFPLNGSYLILFRERGGLTSKVLCNRLPRLVIRTIQSEFCINRKSRIFPTEQIRGKVFCYKLLIKKTPLAIIFLSLQNFKYDQLYKYAKIKTT